MNDRQAVAEPFGLAHDVGGEEDALAVVAEVGHRVQQSPSHQHVQAGGGLVEDQHGRVMDQRPGHRHLLLHAGGHLCSQHVAEVVHRQPLEEGLHPRPQFLVGDAVEAAEILDHLPAGHAIVDGRVGRHEADLAPHPRRLGEDVVAVDGGAAGGGAQHRAEDSQGGGLARPVGTQQAVDFTGPGVEADPPQGNQTAAPQVGVVLRQGVHVNHGEGRAGWRRLFLNSTTRLTRGEAVPSPSERGSG